MFSHSWPESIRLSPTAHAKGNPNAKKVMHSSLVRFNRRRIRGTHFGYEPNQDSFLHLLSPRRKSPALHHVVEALLPLLLPLPLHPLTCAGRRGRPVSSRGAGSLGLPCARPSPDPPPSRRASHRRPPPPPSRRARPCSPVCDAGAGRDLAPRWGGAGRRRCAPWAVGSSQAGRGGGGRRLPCGEARGASPRRREEEQREGGHEEEDGEAEAEDGSVRSERRTARRRGKSRGGRGTRFAFSFLVRCWRGVKIGWGCIHCV